MSEVIEKDHEKKPKRATVSVNLTDVPRTVHKKIIKWNLKLSAERGKQISLMAAYTEWLKESTRNLPI